MENENEFKVKGVIYSKEVQDIKGVKDPTQSYPKLNLTLEVMSKGYRRRGESEAYTSSTNLLVFECFNPRFEVEDFYKDDIVEIDFYIEGKEYVRKTGEKAGEKGLFNKNVITAIKQLDKQGTRDNKIDVTATSDTNELDLPNGHDDPFPDVPVNMGAIKVNDDMAIDDDSSGLPF